MNEISYNLMDSLQLSYITQWLYKLCVVGSDGATSGEWQHGQTHTQKTLNRLTCT